MKVPVTEKRPLILVTNDDGIEAKGVHELVKMIEDLGDIVVVAPDSPRSCLLYTSVFAGTTTASSLAEEDSQS